MVKGTDYQEFAKKAEAAVKGVKDPALRRVAFEKVLDDLLSHGQSKTKSIAAGNKFAKKIPASTKIGAKPHGPQGHVQELVDEGFFKKPKTITEVKAELENRGHHIPRTSLSGPLQVLCQRRILRRQKKKTTGKKETYCYSLW